MGKIAAADNTALNRLVAIGMTAGQKTAAEGEDPQAFDDHKDFIETVESVLADDKKEAWDPNDPLLD